MDRLPPLLLVGGGKMGGAMLAGWVARGLSPSVVVDPAKTAQALQGPSVEVVAALEDVPAGFAPACVVLAVKPQLAGEIVPQLVRFAQKAMILSIMAGQSTDRLRTAMDGGSVVRAMPNTPAAIGRGMTVAFAGPGVNETQKELAGALLAAVGEVAWVDDEALIDPVTAISGGGPAYLFLLAELLEQAGVEQGLPPALARRLARATMSGAGALLAASEDDAATMRRAVTSPGGTTERALETLMAEPAWPALVRKAITAATERSRALAN